MTVFHIWALVMAVLSINVKSETERVVFKVLSVLCLLIPALTSIVR